MAKKFVINGPMFKLALSRGEDFIRVSTTGRHAPVTREEAQASADSGEHSSFSCDDPARIKPGALDWWRMGDPKSGRAIHWLAPQASALSKIRSVEAAEADARGAKKGAPGKALVEALIEAISRGDEAEAARLAPLAADGEDESGQRPLNRAARQESCRMVELLLPHCDANATDRIWGNTALYDAASRGGADCVALLLTVCDPKRTTVGGETALMGAASNGRLDALDLLLPVSDVDAASASGRTALMEASAIGAIDCVERILPHCDPNRVDGKGLTALMLVGIGARPRVGQYLPNDQYLKTMRAILGRANADAKDPDGNTALMRAVGNKSGIPAHYAVPELLPVTDAGAVNAKGETALLIALLHGNATPELLAASNVDQRDEQGRTALMRAVEGRDPAMARILAAVSDADAQDNLGRTALMMALTGALASALDWARASMRCVLTLLPKSDPNIQDAEGRTALMLAMDERLIEVFDMMLPRCDVNLADSNGDTALMRCANSPLFADILMPLSDVRRANAQGETPLMLFVHEPRRVAALIGRSDVDAQDADGATALMLAVDDWRALESAGMLMEVSDLRKRDKKGRDAVARARAAEWNASALARMRGLAVAQREERALRDLIPDPSKPPEPARPKPRKRRDTGL